MSRSIMNSIISKQTKYYAILLILYLILNIAQAKDEINTIPKLTLKSAIELALNNHPSINKTYAQLKAIEQKSKQAGLLADPRLVLNTSNLPVNNFSLSQTPMTQVQLGLIQSIPYPGKLSLQAKVAEEQTKAMNTNIDDTKRQLRQLVKHNWWELFYIDQTLQTISESEKLLTELVNAAETKYSVGQGSQQDVLLAHLEISKIEDHKRHTLTLREKIKILLNSLFNRPNASKIYPDNEIKMIFPNLQSLESLIDIADKHRPELKRVDHEIAAAKNRVSLAEKEKYPDFNVGVIYGWRKSETDLLNVQLSMNLPFYVDKKINRKKDQRNSEWLQQRFNKDEIRNNIIKEIGQAKADYQFATEQFDLLKTRIIPQATQTVDIMLSGYQVNNVDFLDLSRSQINLLNFQLQYWRAYANAKQSLAAIEAATGRKL